MRIPIILISAASLVALGGIAKAADHHFQAVQSGGLTLGVSGPFLPHGANGHVPDTAPGHGSPFTAFEPADLGIPSTDQTNAQHGQALPAQAGPKK
jgi:hypothetical protein